MQEHTGPAAVPYRWRMRGAAAVFIVGMLALVMLNLPRGFDTNLSKIGAGKPALVFFYDSNLVISNQQAGEMDKAREILAQELHFLIADIGRPDAQIFMQRHQAARAQLLLFAADGTLLKRTQALVTAEQLLVLFNKSLAPK